ncbi:uncharacterized protein IUM83_06711 [Phytophthora cinnamomi]|uniref:uncharacterized protein n=1 Tax=Phytophthora cinnamomi TaxID=4785 RepID=UPI003559B082|nr:hypothetical protein IUM83_06711 [Phytophthora cinnamomi]
MSIADSSVRLWHVEVALAARKLLSLGCAYDVRYALPCDHIDGLKLRDFGLNVAAVLNSHVFHVTKTSSAQPRFPVELNDKVAGNFTDDNVPICSIEAGDYVVGMGVKDFLICPRNLEQVGQDVAALGAEIDIKMEQNNHATKAIVFHFILMGEFVRRTRD